MTTTMITNEIVRQFMTKRDPPIDRGVDFALAAALVPVRPVQLQEEAKVTEDAAIGVEGDARAGLVVEDV